MAGNVENDTQSTKGGLLGRSWELWLPAAITGAYVLAMVIWATVDPVKFSEFETLALWLGAPLGVWLLLTWLRPGKKDL